MRSLSRGFHAFLVLVLLLSLGDPDRCRAASGSDDDPHAAWSGSYPGRVLTERFHHRQAVARRQGERANSQELMLQESRALRADLGNIAIIENTGGVVIERNFFDLNATSLTFSRAGGGYTVTPAPLGFREEARANGSPLILADDDARQVSLPFLFPFFGTNQASVFIHSDGNVTFEEADVSTGARSLSRAVTGPPRIAALFDDLDPSAGDAAVRTYATPDAFYVTWDNVPEFSVFGGGSRQTFQLALLRGGTIEFHYRSTNVSEAVVGIMPGRLHGEPRAADLSRGVTTPAPAALAEIFSLTRDLDTLAVSQRFYQNHEDAYDFLVLFNDIALTPGGTTFAFAESVRSEVLGIGDVLPGQPVFDFGTEFGSPRRLQTFMNMGPLSNYPSDPETRIPIVGENNTLSVLTHEAGHRFLAYVNFLDPLFGVPSNRLLGRQLAHWSFFLNTQASVLEGNEITDRGTASPRFRTTAAVNRYSDLDQYLMGLRAPEEVLSTFLVDNASNFSPVVKAAASAPQVGVSFDGSRLEVGLDSIIAAEGTRAPDSRVAQKTFRFAFLLLVGEGAQPSATTLAKIEGFRSRWEDYFEAAADQRATAHTGLVRMLHLSTWPAGGLVRGLAGRARVEIAAAIPTDLDVLLTADTGGITVPSAVRIPAGSLAVEFPLLGNSAGLTRLTAYTNTPGYDTAVSIVEVKSSAAPLLLQVLSGDGQIGGLGAPLPSPVVLRVRDANLLPYSGVPVVLSASGDGLVTPMNALTDAMGQVQANWTLATVSSLNTLTVAMEGVPGSQVTLEALSVGSPPAFSAAGIVNAASFGLGTASPHRNLSPGGLVTIFGEGLALETRDALSLPLPLLLGGVGVTFNGVPAPLLYVSPRQINVQVPFEIGGPSVEIEIQTPAGTTPAIAVGTANTQPGIFFDFTSGLGAIVNVDDGTPVWVRPASVGAAVSIFCTGLGAVSPAGLTGAAAPASPPAKTQLQVSAQVGGLAATVTFSGLAPGFAGLYQVNVELPPDLPPGRHLLSITAGGRQSNEVPIEVQ
jgi:uncharacterized protein (TIGR03437 family)